MRKSVTFLIVASALLHIAAKPVNKTDSVFWVYKHAGAKENHYIPSGWMGDFGDLKFNPRFLEKPAAPHCIQVKYSAERKEGAGWAGIYWQDPANNWGDKKGGWNLTGFKTLKFKARGETGKEYIEKFLVGGISGQGESSDSVSTDTGGLELTKDWKEYELSLADQDLSEVIGGFGFVVSADSNPNGQAFYLKEIRFEK